MNGLCPNAADKPEFTPVHDMHLGIVSSSLGPRGGDACPASAMALAPFNNVPAHNDDQAHLLNRSLTYSANGSVGHRRGRGRRARGRSVPLLVPDRGQHGEEARDPATPSPWRRRLIQDFTDLVGGTGVFGCGIESQLESWYRFLVQPDPYASISIKGNLGNATGVWNGVDQTILQQRHDFLRPDSLVLVVVLSDENDSEIDVRSIGGLGVNWMAGAFQPPNGTAACASNPGSPACQSCAQGSERQERLAVPAEAELHGDQRLGLRPQPSPRPHEGEVRRRPAVPHRAVRNGAHVDLRAGPQRRVPVRARARTSA